MEAKGPISHSERSRVRVALGGSGTARVATGLSVLDHLLDLLAAHADFDLELELAPESPGAEVALAGRSLGESLHAAFRRKGVRGHGSAALPAAEALAHVALEVSDQPLVVANVDLSDERLAGLGSDLVSTFLNELTDAAGLTLHVRVIDGEDAHHVLEAIFKALGVALGQAARPRRKE